jgi:ADP-ribose pyrophosphatase
MPDWQTRSRDVVFEAAPFVRVVRETVEVAPGKIIDDALPGGFIDPGEDPEQAARRELTEETGLIAGNLINLGHYVDNGNQRGCLGHYFLAPDCLPYVGFSPDLTENFTLAAMTPAALDAALDRGEFGIIHHVAGWLLARRHLPK